MKTRFALSCTWALAVIAAATAWRGVSRGDTITLNSGDSFTGTITRIGPDTVDVTTTFAGVIHVKRETVKSMRSDAQVAVAPAEGAAHNTFVAPTSDGTSWHEVAAAVAPAPPAPAVPATPPAPPALVKAYDLNLEPYYLPVGPHWKNQFSLGLVNTTGNTEATNFAAGLNFAYKDKPHELTLALGGVYDVTEGTQTAGQFFFDGIYRRSIPEWDKSDRWYLYGENHELYDAIKGISYRITNSVGLGYFVFKEENFTLDLRSGPAYVCEKFFNGDSNSSMSGLVGLRAVYKINERTTLSEEALYTTSVQDFRDYQLTSETALNLKLPELARGAGLKLGFRDDYDSASNSRKNNDTRLTLSVTLDF